MIYLKTFVKLPVALILIFLWTSPLVTADSPDVLQNQAEENLVYTVQSGDTIILLALRHNLTPAEIALSIAAELVCVRRKSPLQARQLRTAVGVDL